MNMSYRKKTITAGVAGSIFLVVLFSHFLSRNLTSGDSAYSIHTAMSIIKDGNIDLDEYEEVIKARTNQLYTVKQLNGHYYYAYPVGAPVLSIPIVFLVNEFLPPLLDSFPSIEKYIRNRVNLQSGAIVPESIHSLVEVFIASISIALTAVCLYFVAINFVGARTALLVVFIFAFCTGAWSSASRALWPHGPSMFMLALALLIIIRSDKKPNLIWLASIPLALSYIIRPTNIVSVIAFTILVFFRYRKFFLRYLSGLVIPLGIYFIFSFITYGALISPTYMSQGFLPGSNFAEGLFGVLISPSRGLFIFSPVLKKNQFAIHDNYLLGILFFHWLMIGTFPRWWAGWSFGPRYFSDVIPFLIYFMLPALKLPITLKGAKYWAYNSLIAFFVAFGFFVHFRGAMHRDVLYWNASPVSIDLALERLWDWKDVQFLRGMFNDHSDFFYRARLDRISMVDEEDLRYTIRISNTGTYNLKRRTNEVLRVGCRVFNNREDDASLVLELREELPKDVIRKGDSFDTTFIIEKELLEKGSYMIEFDLIRENKVWFKTIGSESLIDNFIIL
jgi:hypothetical protein